MESSHVGEAVALLEKANASLELEPLAAPDASKLLEAYARTEKLAAFGVAALARKLDDASELARVTAPRWAGPKLRGRNHPRATW